MPVCVVIPTALESYSLSTAGLTALCIVLFALGGSPFFTLLRFVPRITKNVKEAILSTSVASVLPFTTAPAAVNRNDTVSRSFFSASALSKDNDLSSAASTLLCVKRSFLLPALSGIPDFEKQALDSTSAAESTAVTNARVQSTASFIKRDYFSFGSFAGKAAAAKNTQQADPFAIFSEGEDIIEKHLKKEASQAMQEKYAKHMARMAGYKRNFIPPKQRRELRRQQRQEQSASDTSAPADERVCKLSSDVLEYLDSMSGDVCRELQALADKMKLYASLSSS